MEIAEDSNGSKLDIRVRWREHAREWARRHLPGMAESREGPKDYEDEEDLRNLVRLAVRAGGQHYHEGGGDEKRLLTWLLVVTGSLTVAAIAGGISMYGKLSAIEQGMNGHEQRIDRLERLNERRYRGADAAP
jgi:hypothetical protein